MRRIKQVFDYERSAPVAWLIALATVGTFVAQRMSGVWRRTPIRIDWVWFELGFDKTRIVEGGEAWRLVTPNFLSTADFPIGPSGWRLGPTGTHLLIGTVAALLIFGPLIERSFGHVRFALIWLLSGAVAYGALFTMRFPPFLQGGGTGAVAGLIGAFVVFALLRRRDPDGNTLVRWASAMFVVLVAVQYLWNIAEPRLLHIGGFAAGLVLGLLFSTVLAPRRLRRGAVAEAAPNRG